MNNLQFIYFYGSMGLNSNGLKFNSYTKILNKRNFGTSNVVHFREESLWKKSDKWSLIIIRMCESP